MATRKSIEELVAEFEVAKCRYDAADMEFHNAMLAARDAKAEISLRPFAEKCFDAGDAYDAAVAELDAARKW